MSLDVCKKKGKCPKNSFLEKQNTDFNGQFLVEEADKD